MDWVWTLALKGLSVRIGQDYAVISSPGPLAARILPHALLGVRRISGITSHTLILKRSEPPYGLAVAVCVERPISGHYICSGSEDAMLRLVEQLSPSTVRHRRGVAPPLRSLEEVLGRARIGVRNVIYGR